MTLLKEVKSNLILQHNEDDVLLQSYIASAIAYSEEYQHKKSGSYSRRGAKIPSTTRQAIVMLASHFYESRDGSTGGFFADNTNAAAQVWTTVNRLLALNKDVII